MLVRNELLVASKAKQGEERNGMEMQLNATQPNRKARGKAGDVMWKLASYHSPVRGVQGRGPIMDTFLTDGTALASSASLKCGWLRPHYHSIAAQD